MITFLDRFDRTPHGDAVLFVVGVLLVFALRAGRGAC